KELDEIVLKALAKEPADRWPSAEAFREALESIGRASIPPAAREKKDLDEKAFEAAAKALKKDPANEDLAVALERVVEPALAWAKAVEVMQAAAKKVEAKEAKIALYYRIARIQETD